MCHICLVIAAYEAEASEIRRVAQAIADAGALITSSSLYLIGDLRKVLASSSSGSALLARVELLEEVVKGAREVLTAECNEGCFCDALVERALATLDAAGKP